MPQAATVEDCDSDGRPVSGTARQARRRASTRPPPKVVQRRDAPSDSGYSSHSSNAQVQTIVATSASSRQNAPPSTSQSKPALQRSESQRGRPAAPSRSASVTRHCTRPDCRDPTCQSQRNKERRYTVSQQIDPAKYAPYMAQQSQPQQPQPQPHQYQYQQPPQYAPPTSTPAVPIMNPQPRPRAPSMSRGSYGGRPASVYGVANVSGWGAPPQQQQQHGPPPSPSAYNYFPPQYQQYVQTPSYGMYGSTPPNQLIPASYIQASPVQASPNFAVAPGLSRTYSTRQAKPPTGPGYSNPPPTSQPTPTHTLSARRQPSGTMPGAFPTFDSSEEESESDSESDYDSEAERRERRRERDREREREIRQSKRDSKLMPPPSRRPSVARHKTTPVVSTSRDPVYREPLQRAPRSDTNVDYHSSDYYSDKTARAAVGRRSSQSHSSRSRQPSVSTAASSTRTKATTVSSGSGSGTKAYIIEDRNGRRREYLSRDQYEELIRQSERMKLEEQELHDRAEAYQRRVQGHQTPELTAENIRKSQRRTSGSHLSGSGHSRKSSVHSLSKQSKPSGDGIRIESGGTTLHVYGDATVEMRPGEDGTSYIRVGSGGSSRDSAYHGSKSSGSRLSRRKDTITEEDGYEPAI